MVVPSPNCPNELSPQHWSEESSRIAQRWSPPVDIVVSVKMEPDWKPGSFNPSDTGCLMSVITPSLDAKKYFWVPSITCVPVTIISQSPASGLATEIPTKLLMASLV
jgi:hypothetical protein